MTWQLKNIAVMCSGTLKGSDVNVDNVNIDSRKNITNSVFLAIVGEKYDGHDFINSAFQNGALCALVNVAFYEQKLSPELKAKYSFVVVDDTKVALTSWAKNWLQYWRSKTSAKVVAISGSNGKTSSKEMLAKVLSESFGREKVLATAGNFNNDIGLPLTILNLRHNHKYAVLEIGINHIGEMASLASIVKPDIALITNAGRAHMEGLESVATVAHEKSMLFVEIVNDGMAIINGDDKHAQVFKDVCDKHHIRQKTFSINRHSSVLQAGLNVEIKTKYNNKNIKIILPTPAIYQGINALAVVIIAQELNVEVANLIETLESYINEVSGRLQIINSAYFTIINDAYNANPDSMNLAINTLSKLSPPRILIMGDMGEVGNKAIEFHFEVISQAVNVGIENILVIGESFTKVFNKARQTFANSERVRVVLFKSFEEIASWLQEFVLSKTPKKNTVEKPVCLIKGSRFMEMEKLINMILPLDENLKGVQ